MNQVSPCQIETEMFKIKIRLLLMSIEGKFSPVELPNVCWHVVGNEVMARFGVLVMQYLLVTKITYHPLVGEMLMNIYRYIYSYPLWWISVSSELLALSWLKTIHETFRLSYGINAEGDYKTLMKLIEQFIWDFFTLVTVSKHEAHAYLSTPRCYFSGKDIWRLQLPQCSNLSSFIFWRD